MKFALKSALLAAIAAAVTLAAATPASAQYNYRPNYGYGPYGMTTPYGISNGGYPAYNAAPTYAPPPAAAAPLVSNPYLGSTGAQATLATTAAADAYYNPYNANPYSQYYNPVGGFLSGAADLVQARANATVTRQKALLVQEEVFRSQLDTRRKIWEEARYERASLMNSEQVRMLGIQNALERARHDPPLNEIWSALSLNDLFNYLVAQQGKGAKGPMIELNEDVLKHINLTTGKDGSNIGLLKGDIKWPVTLTRNDFDETRKKLDDQLTEAKRQAQFGGVKGSLVSDIKTNVQKMQDILQSIINDVVPADYMTAKNYLKMLDDAARALADPNVKDFFTGERSAKGKTVEELLRNMSEKQGLRFAAATPGDEWAYTVLYRALASYDAGMRENVSTRP